MPHDHHHGCSHHHAPADFGRAFLIGILLNTGFIVAEVVWGIRANSLALLADAGHNAGDVLSLALAWAASILSRRLPSGRFTYGLRGSSIIASLTNAVILLVVVGGIGWESIKRLAHPPTVMGETIIYVALAGVLINGATAMLFRRGQDDLNIRGAYLHMAADAAISLGVVISAVLMMQTGWRWLDPLVSLVIAVLIILGTGSLLRESLNLALHAVPKGIDPAAVKTFLSALPGVKEVHDLHIWAMGTTEVASSVHLVMAGGHPGDRFLKDAAHKLEQAFKINHTTIQVEIGDTDAECPFAPEHVV